MRWVVMCGRDVRWRSGKVLAMLLVLGMASWVPLAATEEGALMSSPEGDKDGSIRFFGSEIADLYTREIAESFAGALKLDFVRQGDGKYPAGFMHASPEGQGWHGTFWTRDGGTFMRELALWGCFEEACLSARCLMDLVRKNEAGFYAFPEFFEPGKPASGSEWDGTAAIVIGMVLLWERLPEGHPMRAELYAFLHEEASPLRLMVEELRQKPLIAGSGEFGGGCGIPGLHCNVVQNDLIRLALESGARLEREAGDDATAGLYRDAAGRLSANMLKYLVGADGAWIWCVDPQSFTPDPAIVDHEINKGFGGLNGPGCMYSDALGLEPLASTWPGEHASLKTFEKLYNTPLRKQQFDKYGLWTQFDVFRLGLSSGPSYGDGYALQTMLLFDKLEMADKALCWMATSTFDAQGVIFETGRRSPYYFYERNYSPDAIGKMDTTAGCGPLNLVNVTEQLKVARLILGVDDRDPDETRLVPRVPPSWSGVEAEDWPIRTGRGVSRANIRFEQYDGGTAFALKIVTGPALPRLRVRMGREHWEENVEVAEAEFLVKSASR